MSLAAGGDHLVVASLDEKMIHFLWLKSDERGFHIILRNHLLLPHFTSCLHFPNLKSLCDPVASFPLNEIRSTVGSSGQLGLESLPRPGVDKKVKKGLSAIKHVISNLFDISFILSVAFCELLVCFAAVKRRIRFLQSPENVGIITNCH